MKTIKEVELEEKNRKLQERIDFLIDRNDEKQRVLDKIKELVDKMPYLWYVDEELERIDGTIDLVYKEYTGWKDILELLEEIE